MTLPPRIPPASDEAVLGVLETSDDFVAVFDRQSSLSRFANAKARHWLGEARDFRFSDLAKPFWLDDSEAARAADAWRDTLASGSATWKARALHAVDKKEIAVACRLVAAGKGIAFVARDVTELETLRRTSQEREEEFRRFAYLVSHDLKEPLRMISSYLQLVRRKLPAPLGEVEEFMGFAIDGAKRLGGLLDGLVQYSRIDADVDDWELIETESAFKRALESLSVPVSDTSAVVTVATPLPRLHTSPKLLAALFQHLLANALRFRSQETPRIEIGAREIERAWLFWVKDNGIGIDAADFERAFVVFQRLPEGASPGIGMGLALAKKIVRRLGGIIWIESKKTEGATFFFTLPHSFC